MKRRQGFTLIELLVVVTIISLLISILLPSLKSAREQATITVCQARLRGNAVAAVSYATDSRGYFPNSYYADRSGPTQGGAGVGTVSANDSISAFSLYMSYCQGVKGLYCPTYYHFYWPVPVDGAYNTYKGWQPGGDIWMGYNKIAGSFGCTSVKPLALYATIGGVWADVGNLARYLNTTVGAVKHVDDPSYIGPYYRPYASLSEIDTAAIGQWNGAGYTPIQILGPSGAILWEDINVGTDGWTAFRKTSHNSLIGNNGNYPFDTTSGFNSAFGDGHVEWTFNTCKSINPVQTKSIMVDDSQSNALVRSARY